MSDESTLIKRKELLESLKDRLPPHPLETEWAISGDDVLSSIYRSSDLSRRGVRGLIAEYFFDSEVIPSAQQQGWKVLEILKGDWPYDVLIERNGKKVSIQIKLQRLERGLPKRFRASSYSEVLYDVEVQKTRTGKKREKKNKDTASDESALVPPVVADTRPYPFGAFDILAVNMQPSTRRWSEFRFTVGNWLLERPDSPGLIEIHQPVALIPNDAWTDDVNTCLDWFLSGKDNKVLKEIKHLVRLRRVGNRQE